jgi:Protein of unknown function (DUF3179)
MLLRILSSVLLVYMVTAPTGAETGRDATRPDIADLDSAARRVLSPVPQEGREAMDWLVRHGDRGSVAVLIQLLRWLPEDSDVLVTRLDTLTGAHVGPHWFDWMVWQQDHPEFAPYPGYAGFLADLLARIDPRFRRFVHAGIAYEIRIEEIAWGGVIVDGIPALDNPAVIGASAAGYLNSDDPVFGVEINGDARAYPLQIANWHEMVNDVVGGVPVSLAYCTLCGSGILFNGRASGTAEPFTFGSSGLLYRSNKLMYDRQTDSLWNQFTGRPVMGQLMGSKIELKVFLRVPGGVKAWPLDAFANGTVINDRVGFRDVVVIGDASGRGVRAYEARGRRFTRGASPDEMLAGDARWRVTESALIGPGGESLPRLPGHVAYWFAWAGYFENAVLGGQAP